MDSKRKIDVGTSSSLIDLKAELLKKQKELQSLRGRQQGRDRGVPKSVKKSVTVQAKNPYASQNKGIDKRAQKDLEEKREAERKYDDAVSILEQKAKLYEKMTSEALDHDEEEHPVLSRALVNFTQKAIDGIKDKNSNAPQIPVQINHHLENEDEEEESESYPVIEEEWVEFKDNLGRTRRCLKTDLPSFLARDDELARPENPGVCISSEGVHRLNEMKRQKWDQESAEAAAKDNVHYQDVLYDEIRTHGVGFYKFSKDETVRQEQMKELKKLSEETDATRQKILNERSAKESALQERLKKIKAKKRARLGLPPEEEKEPAKPATNPQEQDEVEIGPPAPTPPETTEEDSKEKRMRAWDFGKPGVFGPKPETFDELDAKWLKDRRADRNPEFAPPKSLSK